MTTVYHLIQQTPWLYIKGHIDNKKLQPHYKKLYESLRTKNPVPNTELVQLIMKPDGTVNAFSQDRVYSTLWSLNNQWLGYTVTHPDDIPTPQVLVYILKKMFDNKKQLLLSMEKIAQDFSNFK
jgi:hypothetical protein